jgi:cell cycle protein kinase DBF2
MQDRDDPMNKGLFVGCKYMVPVILRFTNDHTVTFRHKKTTDDNGKPASPRKPLPMVEENFGTIF